MVNEFKSVWTKDLPAAIVVFLVALPLCLGIALASGAPVASGLVAGVLGGLVAGALSGSALAVTGPAAGLTSLVLASTQDLGSFNQFLPCVMLAGFLQILFGYCRAGIIGHFFPLSVIKGMLAAIGLILILKQIPHAVGYDADFEGDENFLQPDHENTFTEILRAFKSLTAGSIIIASISILMVVLWETKKVKNKKISTYLSGALVAVLVSVMINTILLSFLPDYAIQSTHRVSLPNFLGGLSRALPRPDFSSFFTVNSLVISIQLAIIASLESLLSVEAIDKLDPWKRITPLNRELKAQGVTNVFCGLAGGLPVTAVIVRGTANIAAGAQTKWSSIFHGVVLLLAIVVFPDFINLIPLASLAGILIMIGYKLTPVHLYKDLWNRGVDQFLPFAVTIAAILFTNLLIGILIGMMVAVYFVLRSNFQSAIILVNDGNQYLLKFRRDVSFLNKSSLRKALEAIPNNSRIIIDGSRSHFIDADVVETIQDFLASSTFRNIEVELKKNKHATHQMFRE
ncbi:MAG: SulP family inorganic anion transporter [Bacteroidota bacterium]|jgi:MFS superfamily sulfate permease-like transporter|nr:SulP family inorganic anion transporter [Flammeovirgaceae bacterium]MCZ8069266.1 SulP family inorganic anion transporter [Cytophagales bacterium]